MTGREPTADDELQLSDYLQILRRRWPWVIVATAMVANVSTGDPTAIEETKKILAETSPLLNRPGLAEDVANAALWLASDESGYTNGHTLTTDAGITTGATPNPPAFDEYQPMIREAGKKGL